MSGFEPYAWRLIVTGTRGPDGVPYTAVDTEPAAYESPEIRAAMEDMGRTVFLHQHPGAAVESVRWYPLHGFGCDDE